MKQNPHIISDRIMGEVWPSAHPGQDLSDYGSVKLEGNDPVRIRSFQTFRLIYTVGKFGLDDTGGLKIVQRFTNDGGRLQTSDPGAMNYVTARTCNGTALDIEVERLGHQRPWDRSLCITLIKGYLSEGDTITITLGDTSGGGPGLRMQTFCESAHEFRVLVDACATRQYIPLLDRVSVMVLPEEPYKWHAILPSLRVPGAEFSLGLRADDIWGNPSDLAEGTFRLTADGPVAGLPETVIFSPGQRAQKITGLVAAETGTVRITLTDDQNRVLARSNPLVVREGPLQAYWGDLHGQSGETVGINPVREYFKFGRDLAMLDVMSHQANDFQIKKEFWEEINLVTAEFDRPGTFVAFPGYEWSGNSPTGGDHNVFFRHEGQRIIRSSHALLTDRNDIQDDATTTMDLFEALKNEDCVLYAHIGGRPANIAQADGGWLRTSLEVHSDWGTFEWVMKDSFDLGYRHGLVCNSDGHKGRPGASHPGASSFGALGGLTCFLAAELSRDGIFDSIRRRRHYGTTGGRLYLDVAARLKNPARIFERDPRVGETQYCEASILKMGDIAAVQDDHALVSVRAETQTPLVAVDILRGAETLKRCLPYGKTHLGRRYRVCFHGAEYRGRGRQTTWTGWVKVKGANIERFERINAWNHDRKLEWTEFDRIEFNLLTTGNFVGFDIWLDNDAECLDIATSLVAGSIELSEMDTEPVVLDAGGLDRKVTVTRLPETLTDYGIEIDQKIILNDEGDTPIWVRVSTEDGHLAWSSPMYLFKREAND